MKIETKTITVFEDGDCDLIFSKLPKNPCDECYLGRNGGCCGCPDNTEYLKKIKPLKEANVFELTTKANEYYYLTQEIKKIREKKDILAEEFLKLGLDINYIFNVLE